MHRSTVHILNLLFVRTRRVYIYVFLGYNSNVVFTKLPRNKSNIPVVIFDMGPFDL